MDTTLPADLRQKALDEIITKLKSIEPSKTSAPIPDVLIKAMAECRISEVVRIAFPAHELMPDLSNKAKATGLSYAYQELVNDWMSCWRERNVVTTMLFGVSRKTATQIITHLREKTYGA